MNVTLDFGGLLTRAWGITWKHRVLWIFGILASLGRGGGGSSGGSSGFDGNGQSPITPDGNFNLPPELERFLGANGEGAILGVIIGLMCLGLLLAVVLIVLQTLGTGGLIGGIEKADATGSVTFGEAWGLATSKFLRLLGLTLIIAIVSFVAALIVIVPSALLAVATLGIGLLCLFPVICVFAIALMLLGLIVQFAQIGVVVDDLSVFDALRRGWELFRANLANVIILAVIIGVIAAIIGVVVALPLAFTIFPVVAGMAGFATENQALAAGGIGLALVCFCLYLPVLLVATGILQTWTTAAFTLAYKQLLRPAAPSAPLDLAPNPPTL